MKAAVVRCFGASENIQTVANWELPKIIRAQQVLIKVKAAGINPVDTYIRSGVYGVLPNLPYIPGRDGAGIVEEVGESVRNVRKGDRVWFLAENDGSTAEYTVSSRVFPLPNDVTFAQGAAIGVPYLTAYRALFMKGPLKPASKILVHGASGGVGLAAVQLATWRGYEVVGTAGTREGCENVQRNGAARVYNHRDSDYVVNMKTEYPTGFDLIVEMAAHINLETDMGLLVKNGRICIVGNRGETTINARALMTLESSIYGISLAHSTQEEYYSMALEVNELFSQTEFRPVVQREYSLDQLPEAHVDVMQSAGALGNLVVMI